MKEDLINESAARILVSPTANLEEWLQAVRAQIDETLGLVLAESAESTKDPCWLQALSKSREFSLRPGKRLRPALLLLGYRLSSQMIELPPPILKFATAVELLHTFMLVHDDIADGAETRRGGPALHRVFGLDRRSEDLAVIMGDYLFARAIEIMLSSGLARAAAATEYYLGACREAAIGQYLDSDLDNVRLPTAHLLKVLRIARLKTARPSFVAPLVAGGLLAGTSIQAKEILARIGCYMGLAFQLRDDLLGLFGEPKVMGKPCDRDLLRGKGTFPVLAAYLRAPQEIRSEMHELWSQSDAIDHPLPRARELVRRYGGQAATERLIARSSQIAREALKFFPQDSPGRRLLDELIEALIRRNS